MLKERVISALVGAPLIIASLLLGKYVFALLIVIIAVIATDEFYSMLILREFKPNIVAGIGGSIAIFLGTLAGGASGLLLALVLVTLVVLVWQTFTEGSIVNAGLTITGLAYISLPLSHLILLYGLAQGVIGMALVLVATWVSDIAAYAFGRAIGKRKLAPTISAKKTIEGTIAGIIAPTIFIGTAFLLPWLPFVAEQGAVVAILKGLGFGLIVGVVAPVGDLIESRIKRELRVKDSGATIPGHGGFLDRFDSVIVAGVIAYYYWLFVV